MGPLAIVEGQIAAEGSAGLGDAADNHVVDDEDDNSAQDSHDHASDIEAGNASNSEEVICDKAAD
jgi:hypothetical protein